MLTSDLSQWVGRTEIHQSTLGSDVIGMLLATVSTGQQPRLRPGDELPFLAHWCAFTPKVPMGALSTDGHPKPGDFLPPVRLERRMWAGGALTFHAPLHLDARLERRSTIASVEEKSGVSGPMVFVKMRHELHEGDTFAVTETQDIVYLQIPDRFTPPRAKPVMQDADVTQAVDVNEAMLFRFSAATFNAHRIHYDLTYAQEVEKYPGLVVHGPLQAILLMQAALTHAGRTPQHFSFRGIHPMFHDDDLHLFGKDTENGMTLCTGIPGGHQGMQAKITWEAQQ